MLFTILLVGVLLLILALVGLCKKENFVNMGNLKPKLWIYLETKYNSRKWHSFYSQSNQDHVPDYLNLCLDTIKNKCEDTFDIHLVSTKNYKKYLPNLKINQKSNLDYNKDLIAANLLNKYGGIWLPASTLVLKDISQLYRKVVQDNLYFSGFSCDDDEYRCNEGSNYLLNQSVYISNKNTPVTQEWVNQLEKINNTHLSDYSFLKTGQKMLSKILNKWTGKVEILPASVNGTRDCIMKNISADNLLSNNVTSLLDHDSTLMVTFNRDIIDNNTKYNWFTRASKKQILLSDVWFSHLTKIGLDSKTIKTYKTVQPSKDNYFWKSTQNLFIGKSPTRNS